MDLKFGRVLLDERGWSYCCCRYCCYYKWDDSHVVVLLFERMSGDVVGREDGGVSDNGEERGFDVEECCCDGRDHDGETQSDVEEDDDEEMDVVVVERNEKWFENEIRKNNEEHVEVVEDDGENAYCDAAVMSIPWGLYQLQLQLQLYVQVLKYYQVQMQC